MIGTMNPLAWCFKVTLGSAVRHHRPTSPHSPTTINPFMIATMNPLAWCFNVTRLGHRAEGSTMGELATMAVPTTNTKRRTVHCSNTRPAYCLVPPKTPSSRTSPSQFKDIKAVSVERDSRPNLHLPATTRSTGPILSDCSACLAPIQAVVVVEHLKPRRSDAE